MIRENGYLIIDDYQKIEKTFIGSFSKGWYTDGEDEYLFKILPELYSYRELYYSILLKDLELPTPENDLARLNNDYGIISKSYNQKNNFYYTIEEILKEYEKYNSIKNINKKYNLKNLPYVIKWFCKNKNFNYSLEQLKKETLIKFIIQLIFGNSDLRSKNMELTYNPESQASSLLMFYDFSHYGNVKLITNTCSYFFSARKNFRSPRYNIETFKNKSLKKDLKLLKEYLEKAKMINLERKIEMIEYQTEEKIPKDIKIKLLEDTRTTLNEIDMMMKKR